MKIRATDATGDWTFGHGKSNYRVGVAAIIQDIDTALHVFLGECFWATDFGVDWWNLIGEKAPQAQQNILLQCREVIQSRVGVSKINSVSVEFSSYRRNLTLTYDVSTVFGSFNTTFSKGFNKTSS